MQAFEKLTRIVDGEPRIISDPPLIVPIDELVPAEVDRNMIQGEIHDIIRSYRRTLETDRRHLLEQFRFVDLARKVVGVGSVGTRAWIALFLGIDDDDPLFLQLKEAQPSVLERFVGKSQYANCGQRVVAGQRLMQATSDIFLGWQHVGAGLDGEARDFYVRQLKDWKGSFAIEAAAPARSGRLRAHLRLDARARPRPLRRPGRDLRVPRRVGRLRPGDRRLRRDLRRPERTRLPGAAGRRQRRTPQSRDGALTRRQGGVPRPPSPGSRRGKPAARSGARWRAVRPDRPARARQSLGGVDARHRNTVPHAHRAHLQRARPRSAGGH